LVEISPKAVPPVCKIIDYKKFLYEQKKREKVLKAKSTKVVVKEIRSIIFKDKGQILLLKLAQELEEYGKVESLPTMEGKKMIMFVAPKK
jgi:translation initiation factor IF-3